MALHFPTNSLPPVDAFWSLTLYEESGDGRFFLTDNSVNRYAIGDRTPTLSLGSDGSLDIAIQRAEPGGALSGNWLPALAGAARFILLMRLSAWQADDRPAICPPAGIARLNRAGASSLGLQLQPTRRSDTGITALI
jgi:hypothetical protein